MSQKEERLEAELRLIELTLAGIAAVCLIGMTFVIVPAWTTDPIGTVLAVLVASAVVTFFHGLILNVVEDAYAFALRKARLGE